MVPRQSPLAAPGSQEPTRSRTNLDPLIPDRIIRFVEALSIAKL